MAGREISSDQIRSPYLTHLNWTAMRQVVGRVLLTLGAMISSQKAALSQQRVPLPGPFPYVEVRHAVDEGPMKPSAPVRITFTLPLRHRAELEDLLQRIYDPADPLYERYLQPAEFAARYGAAAEDYNLVSQYARSFGLTVVFTSQNHLVLGVEGTAEEVRQAIGSDLHQYRRADGTAFFAPVVQPTAPALIATKLTGIVGFADNDAPPPLVCKTSDTHLTPLDSKAIETAYDIPVLQQPGHGQVLALVEQRGYISADITQYERSNGLPDVNVVQIPVDTRYNPTAPDGTYLLEATIDIDLVAALVPDLQELAVYEATPDGNGMLEAVTAIAEDPTVQVASTSWENGIESPDKLMLYNSENQVFMEMAACGKSMFASSGDHEDPPMPAVRDPSSQPYVCSVGGTSLSVDAQGQYVKETAWYGPMMQGVGGASTIWPIPFFQKPISQFGGATSTAWRNVPDVSLNAGWPNSPTPYALYFEGRLCCVGGTSASAPLWAAFTVLVNQRRSKRGLLPIGFINPALYRLAMTERYNSDFHDIHDCSTNGAFHAVYGYDNVTGLGSFDGAKLLDDLASPESSLQAPIGYGDLNGDGKVTIEDAIVALKIATHLTTPTDLQILAGDVTPATGTCGRRFGDGQITVSDVIAILQAVVGTSPLHHSG